MDHCKNLILQVLRVFIVNLLHWKKKKGFLKFYTNTNEISQIIRLWDNKQNSSGQKCIHPLFLI
jgi:hypothetical protein